MQAENGSAEMHIENGDAKANKLNNDESEKFVTAVVARLVGDELVTPKGNWDARSKRKSAAQRWIDCDQINQSAC